MIPEGLEMTVGFLLGVLLSFPVGIGIGWLCRGERNYTEGVVDGASIAAHTETRGTPVTPLPVPESDEEAFGGGWAS